MNRKSNSVQKSGGIALGGNRNVIIHGISELFITKGQQRERTVRYYAVNRLRTVEMPEYVATRRVFRLRGWQAVSNIGGRDPRPTLPKLDNPRHRETINRGGDFYSAGRYCH